MVSPSSEGSFERRRSPRLAASSPPFVTTESPFVTTVFSFSTDVGSTGSSGRFSNLCCPERRFLKDRVFVIPLLIPLAIPLAISFEAVFVLTDTMEKDFLSPLLVFSSRCSVVWGVLGVAGGSWTTAWDGGCFLVLFLKMVG